MSFLSKFSSRSFDWVLFIATLFLSTLGLAAIYSVDLSRGEGLFYFKKQILSLLIGVIFCLGASVVRFTFYRSYAKHIYYITLAVLVTVLLAGTTIRGTRGWFIVGGMSIQPVEFAKISVILILAYVMYHFGRRYDRALFFFGTAAIAGLAAILVLFQPDLGSALIIGSLWFALMLLMGARKLFILGLLGALVLFSIFAWSFLLKPYQKDRIRIFINPERDPLVTGYNINQAIIAVGAGQFLGRGLGFGSQSQLRFLPEAQTDFVFSVIAEELGFAGVFLLVGLYAIIMLRIVRLASRASDEFVAVTLSGAAILFFIQFFINVGGNTGLLPLTGVPLPFVSYGGSSLIANLLLIGIAESMVEKKY